MESFPPSKLGEMVPDLNDSSFETWQAENLVDAWEQLLALGHDCEALTQRRQELLREGSNVSKPSMTDQRVVGYLYQASSFTYSVLIHCQQVANSFTNPDTPEILLSIAELIGNKR